MSEESESGRDDETIAAEFVLGLLDGDDRAAASQRAQSDPSFQKELAKWEERFAALLATLPHIPPPERLKTLIDEQLFHGHETASGVAPIRMGRFSVTKAWESLVFWRWCSAAVAALAALLIVAVFFGERRKLADTHLFIASLNPADAAASILVRVDIRSGVVSIRAFDVDDEGRATELWLIPRGGAPKSLGVFDPSDDARVNFLPENRSEIRDGASIAISLEPAGGSLTGAPTGPIIAIGNVEPL